MSLISAGSISLDSTFKKDLSSESDFNQSYKEIEQYLGENIV